MTPGTPLTSAVLRIVMAVLALAASAGCDADDPPRREVPSGTSGPFAPETPTFRFAVSARRIETTDRRALGQRDRRRVQDALDAVRERVTDLYVAGFLDPGGWQAGDYDAVFDLFAGDARAVARERATALTAGTDAAGRFTAIEPAGGTVRLRALVDRSGAATVVSSVVRFRARAAGDEPAVFRSEGTYLFRRSGAGWKIVAFDVVRRDRQRAA